MINKPDQITIWVIDNIIKEINVTKTIENNLIANVIVTV